MQRLMLVSLMKSSGDYIELSMQSQYNKRGVQTHICRLQTRFGVPGGMEGLHDSSGLPGTILYAQENTSVCDYLFACVCV